MGCPLPVFSRDVMSRIAKTDVPAGSDLEKSTSLDPTDWQAFREAAHRMLDDTIDHIANVRQKPVWQPMPSDTRARFARALPDDPRVLDDVLDDIRTHIFPHATGNLHPLFMGWVHGAGTPVGMVAEMVAAGLNMNCGGRDHVGIEVEKQVARWMAEALGYPLSASGLFVTGSSMANFLALTIARTEALSQSVRRDGLRKADRQLVAYTSSQAHVCIAQAMELSGIGSANLRSIAVDDAGRMSVEALAVA